MVEWLPFLVLSIVLFVIFAWIASRMKFARLQEDVTSRLEGQDRFLQELHGLMSGRRGAEPLTVFIVEGEVDPDLFRKDDVVVPLNDGEDGEDGEDGRTGIALRMASLHAGVVRSQRLAGRRVGVSAFPSPASSPTDLVAKAKASYDREEWPELPQNIQGAPDQSRFLDSATGVLAARHIGRVFGRFLKRARQRKQTSSLILCGIDGGERLRDRLGPDGLDAVMGTLSLRIQRCLREDDLIGRITDSEFIIIMEHGRDGAAGEGRVSEDVGRRILRVIREESVVVGSDTLFASASMGIAVHGRGQSLNQLFERAERCLNTARAKGAGQLTLYQD